MSDFENDQLQDRDFERYGVWVKAGPEDVVETDDDFGFEDLDTSLTPDDFSTPSTASTAAPPEDDSEMEVSFDLDDDVMTIDDLGIEEPDVEPDPFSSLADDAPETEEDFVAAMPGVEESDELADLEFEEDADLEGEELPELESEAIPVGEHDFTPEDQGIDIESEPVNMLTADEEQFLDEEDPSVIDEFRDDLQISPDRAIPSEMDQQEQAAFQRIQDELAAIKSELALLRQQLAERPVTSAAPQPASVEVAPDLATDLDDDFGVGRTPPLDEPAVEEPVFDEDDAATAADSAEVGEVAGHGPGFFEEDEDETIALTGDELDNILNTAEFVEETGEAEVIDDDFAIAAGQAYEPSAIIEGDEQHVDHLAEMDIDKELAGIDELSDETMEPSFEATETGSADDLNAGFDEFADAVEDELHPETPSNDDLILEESGLELEIEDESAFDSTPGVADDESASETEEIELGDVDELEIDDIDLDAGGIDDVEIDEIEIGDVPIDEPQIEESPEEELQVDDEEAFEEPESEIGRSPDTTSGPARASLADLPDELKAEIRSILSYMDHLLEALPDEKIQEFAQSEHFEVYKRLFEELGLDN